MVKSDKVAIPNPGMSHMIVIGPLFWGWGRQSQRQHKLGNCDVILELLLACRFVSMRFLAQMVMSGRI